MRDWNVPLLVVKTMSELAREFADVNLTKNYSSLFLLLSQNNIKDTTKNRELLLEVMGALKDKNTDYHIMNLEGLFANKMFEEGMTLREKMEEIYRSNDFGLYKKKYSEDINCMKALFLESIAYASNMQEGRFVIFKYGAEVSYYDLWNEFYMETRGVVIDMENLKLVSSPYRKFFNFNEKEMTSPKQIQTLIERAYSVEVQNKEDGSMVSVSRYEDELIVSTPGLLASEQAKWARAFLLKTHMDFLKAMPNFTTFIFEAIYPDNRIVIDYMGDEKMVLTGARDNQTGQYLSRSIIEDYAHTYDIPLPTLEDKSLDQLLLESKDKTLHPADKKEGWVITVRTEDETVLFKVKCEDYCEIHRVIGVANSPKVVFEHIVKDSYDDFISKVPDIVKPLVEKVAEVIYSHIQQVKAEANLVFASFPEEIRFTQSEMEKSSQLKLFVKEQVLPLMDTKLSRNKRTEIEESLISKAFGKEPSIDKYTKVEFDRLWSLLPQDLKEQQGFKKKEGRMLGFVYKQVPERFRGVALDFARGQEVNYLSLIDLKDIDFSFLNDRGTEEDVA